MTMYTSQAAVEYHLSIEWGDQGGDWHGSPQSESTGLTPSWVKVRRNGSRRGNCPSANMADADHWYNKYRLAIRNQLMDLDGQYQTLLTAYNNYRAYQVNLTNYNQVLTAYNNQQAIQNQANNPAPYDDNSSQHRKVANEKLAKADKLTVKIQVNDDNEDSVLVLDFEGPYCVAESLVRPAETKAGWTAEARALAYQGDIVLIRNRTKLQIARAGSVIARPDLMLKVWKARLPRAEVYEHEGVWWLSCESGYYRVPKLGEGIDVEQYFVTLSDAIMEPSDGCFLSSFPNNEGIIVKIDNDDLRLVSDTDWNSWQSSLPVATLNNQILCVQVHQGNPEYYQLTIVPTVEPEVHSENCSLLLHDGSWVIVDCSILKKAAVTTAIVVQYSVDWSKALVKIADEDAWTSYQLVNVSNVPLLSHTGHITELAGEDGTLAGLYVINIDNEDGYMAWYQTMVEDRSDINIGPVIGDQVTAFFISEPEYLYEVEISPQFPSQCIGLEGWFVPANDISKVIRFKDLTKKIPRPDAT